VRSLNGSIPTIRDRSAAQRSVQAVRAGVSTQNFVATAAAALLSASSTVNFRPRVFRGLASDAGVPLPLPIPELTSLSLVWALGLLFQSARAKRPANYEGPVDAMEKCRPSRKLEVWGTYSLRVTWRL
jgi:hypothetical protein